jgi:hypothetical protein
MTEEDQETLWLQATLLLKRLKVVRNPPPIGLDHALTDEIIAQAEDTLASIKPPSLSPRESDDASAAATPVR